MKSRGVIGVVGGGILVLGIGGCTPPANLTLFQTPPAKKSYTPSHSVSRTSATKKVPEQRSSSTTTSTTPPAKPVPQLSERRVKEVKICNKSDRDLVLGLGKELNRNSCLAVYKSTRYNLYKMLIETHYRVTYRLHFLPEKGVVEIDITSAEPIALATKVKGVTSKKETSEEGRERHHREKKRSLLPFFYW